MKKLLFIIISLLLFSAQAWADLTYYCSNNGSGTGLSIDSPGSIATVKALARVNASSDDITIYLRGGRYPLAEPLSFTAADSGAGGHKIYWKSYPGESPVLSGGQQITGWSLADAGKNIYSASVPPGSDFRQLYVNGRRAQRVRFQDSANIALAVPWSYGYCDGSGSTGYDGTDQGLCENDNGQWITGNTDYSATGLSYAYINSPALTLARPQDVEFVFNGLGGLSWSQSRLGVASYDAGTKTFTMDSSYDAWFTFWQTYYSFFAQPFPDNPVWIENAYEFLSASTPGEWYLNKGTNTVYYVPRPGEVMSSADVVFPVLVSLVSGSSSDPVSNVEFWGISFEHAGWLTPTTQKSFFQIQANYYLDKDLGYPGYPWTQIPDAVSLPRAQNVRFERCTFQHLGAAGLALGDGAKDCTVQGCTFTDISGNGLRIGEFNNGNPVLAAQTSRITVRSNYIHDAATEYWGGVSISVGYVDHVQLLHNEIANCPYSAISFGWGWGISTYANSNEIAYNKIYGIMQGLGDGGAIYLQSAQGDAGTKTTVHDNYIYDNVGIGGLGAYLYPDEGTQYVDFTNNVMVKTAVSISPYWYHGNYINSTNNTASSNYATASLSIYFTGGATGDIAAATIISGESPSGWATEPKNIALAAGLDSGYLDIKSSGTISRISSLGKLGKISNLGKLGKISNVQK